jgi:hypothetical protein
MTGLGKRQGKNPHSFQTQACTHPASFTDGDYVRCARCFKVLDAPVTQTKALPRARVVLPPGRE